MHVIVVCFLAAALTAWTLGQTVVTKGERGQTTTVTSQNGQKVTTKTEGGRTMVRIEGGAFIPELGCALGDEGGQVKVIHAMPANNRTKAYANVDLQANDLILMVNAKPLKSADAFRTLYEAKAAGDTITLGIKRGESLHLAPFVKMDAKDMPKGQKIIIRKNER
jgi:hypothetical protein